MKNDKIKYEINDLNHLYIYDQYIHLIKKIDEGYLQDVIDSKMNFKFLNKYQIQNLIRIILSNCNLEKQNESFIFKELCLTLGEKDFYEFYFDIHDFMFKKGRYSPFNSLDIFVQNVNDVYSIFDRENKKNLFYFKCILKKYICDDNFLSLISNKLFLPY
tara:strand:+ start:1224 stop:1703 length:480 start_codon:yes stop_codon:yes gene_type:complete